MYELVVLSVSLNFLLGLLLIRVLADRASLIKDLEDIHKIASKGQKKEKPKKTSPDKKDSRFKFKYYE